MLIFLEGLPGVGKSTNSGLLLRQSERNGLPTSWVHEFARPHPLLFFNEACLTKDEARDWRERHRFSDSLVDRFAVARNGTVGFDLLEMSWHYKDALSEEAFREIEERGRLEILARVLYRGGARQVEGLRA